VIHAAGAGRTLRLSAVTLAGCVFALLVAGSVVAVFYAQELKREVPLLMEPAGRTVNLDPTGNGIHPLRWAHFHVKTSVDDVVDVSVVTTTGRVVAVIRRGLPTHAYDGRIDLHWDGRTSTGALAAPGYYRVQVHLRRSRRTIVAPTFLLHLEAGPG
jgi:hypothetical protein